MCKFVILIDYSFCFHVSRHRALEAVVNDYDFMDALLFHFEGKIRTLKKILEDNNIRDYDLICAEDRQSTRKMVIYPEYKCQRQDLSVPKLELKNRLKEKYPEIYFCHAEGEEADDVIATLAKMAVGENKAVVIFTGDKDLWQLIGNTVTVLNPITKKFITCENVEKAFKTGVLHIPLVKSFWGDPSDGIPNVLPRMQKHLLPIIRISDGTFDHCNNLILNTSLPDKCSALYRENWASAFRNYQLVKLNPDCNLIWN